MKDPFLRTGHKLHIANRVFVMKNIWYLGNNPSRYELQETRNGKDVGPLLTKEASVILNKIEAKEIIIEK